MQSEPGPVSPAGAPTETGRPGGRALAWAGIAFGLAAAAYVADVALHPLSLTFRFFDLNIYNQAGLLVRHDPATLYTWHFMPGVQYLYTPFAAAGFAVTSLLPWALLKWLMAAASFAAVPLTVWVTFGQLGWRGRRRQAAVLGVSAVAIWMEPVLVCHFGPHFLGEVFRLHGFQLVSWNVYVLPGLAMLALMVAWAAMARRRRHVPPRDPLPAVRRTGRMAHAAADSSSSSGGRP